MLNRPTRDTQHQARLEHDCSTRRANHTASRHVAILYLHCSPGFLVCLRPLAGTSSCITRPVSLHAGRGEVYASTVPQMSVQIWRVDGLDLSSGLPGVLDLSGLIYVAFNSTVGALVAPPAETSLSTCCMKTYGLAFINGHCHRTDRSRGFSEIFCSGAGGHIPPLWTGERQAGDYNPGGRASSDGEFRPSPGDLCPRKTAVPPLQGHSEIQEVLL